MGASDQTIQFNVAPLAPVLALGDTRALVQSGGDLTISQVLRIGTPVVPRPNIALSTRQAVGKSCARKNTQVMLTSR